MIVISENNAVHTINNVRTSEWLSKPLPDGVLFIVDEDTELGQKIISAGYFFEPVIDDNGDLIDIIPLERPEPPSEPYTPSNAEIMEMFNLMWGLKKYEYE